MRYINLTPHAVTVCLPEGSQRVFPASGVIARVDETFLPVDPIDELGVNSATDDAGEDIAMNADTVVDGSTGDVPLFGVSFGKVHGLPEEQPGVSCIVSRIVAQAAPSRHDLVFPGQMIRDGEGRVVGCSSFAKLLSECQVFFEQVADER